jgi:hypothetical protein
MILAAGHALVSASARKVDDDGGIEQMWYPEDSRSADHGRTHVGAS